MRPAAYPSLLLLAACSGGGSPPASILVRDRRITTEVTDRLRAIYTGPKRLNPTAWTMLYDGAQADGAQPADVCS